MYDRLTQSDIDKMQEEIDHRKLVVRPQILKEVREARAQGDLSENFEYYAARKAKGENKDGKQGGKEGFHRGLAGCRDNGCRYVPMRVRRT